MHDITELFKSPTFWFASVIVGFLISLFAGFSKDWIEKLWNSISLKRLKAIELREVKFKEKVEKLKRNPELLHAYQVEIIYQKIRQVLYMIVFYFGMFLGFYSYFNGTKYTALVLAFMGLFVFLIPVQLITRKLLRFTAMVNAAIEDDEKLFLG